MLTRRTFVRHTAMGLSATAIGCERAAHSRSPADVEPADGRSVERPPVAAPDRWADLRGLCDGIAEVTPDERAERRARLQATMRASGVHAVVVEAGTNLDYLTGVRWRPSERPLLGIVPSSGDPVFVGPAFEHHTLAERLPAGARVVDWAEHAGASDAAARTIVELAGTKHPKVALDPEMRAFVVDGLAGAMGDARSAGWSTELRARKTTAELARLRRANEATKAALEFVAPFVTPGMTESEVRALVHEAQEAAGLSDIWVLALAGPNAAFPHGTRHERTLVDGDLMLVDTGGSLSGYQSDITRTWAIGTPSDQARTAWDAVRAAQQAAFDTLRPGVTCGAIDAAARKVIGERGYGEGYSAFTHRLGHGIGMRGHESPYLVKDAPTVLAPGMTFSNEPGIYVQGDLGVRIEDIFAITEDGYEVFGPLAVSLDQPFG